jgi:small conductance mechanosensitive channel
MADPVNQSFEVIGGVSESINPIISKIALAVVILLVGLIVGKLIGNLIRKILNEVELDKHIRSSTGFRWSLEKGISNLVSYFIYLVSIILCLNSLGLTTAILVLIAAAIVFVITLSFLLAIKDFFPNFIAGLRIKLNKTFSPGDEIQIREVKGTIISVGFLETRLRTAFKEEVIIPNSIFGKRQLIIRKNTKKSKKENK